MKGIMEFELYYLYNFSNCLSDFHAHLIHVMITHCDIPYDTLNTKCNKLNNARFNHYNQAPKIK